MPVFITYIQHAQQKRASVQSDRITRDGHASMLVEIFAVFSVFTGPCPWSLALQLGVGPCSISSTPHDWSMWTRTRGRVARPSHGPSPESILLTSYTTPEPGLIARLLRIGGGVAVEGRVPLRLTM